MSTHPLNITLKQLRVLLSVADEGGFRRAGDAIGLSQPAVSQCVRALEAALGVKLLDRTTREVLLTPAGESLVGPLRRALDELQDLLARTQALGAQSRGVVRVASAPTVSAGLMPRCLSAALRRHPEIQVLLTDQAQRLVLDSVRSGAVDFAVVVGGERMDDLEQQTVFEEDFVLVCPAAHALARRRQVPLSALADQPLVLLDHTSGSRPLIDDALRHQGSRARVVLDVGSAATAFRMVAEGLGLSILPSLSLPLPDASALRAVPLAPALRRRIALVARRNRSLSPAAQRIWALVAEIAAQPPSPAAGGPAHLSAE
ncbi:LysR family transcriptional regulator [Aquincola sp. MAHUQ-54]|uniref:LysR family transcriptional regulator n=1 Tax=Aquincola agrisoli TaxID=3119538 RepID=A0AAW9Q4W5_9BURK